MDVVVFSNVVTMLAASVRRQGNKLGHKKANLFIYSLSLLPYPAMVSS